MIGKGCRTLGLRKVSHLSEQKPTLEHFRTGGFSLISEDYRDGSLFRSAARSLRSLKRETSR